MKLLNNKLLLILLVFISGYGYMISCTRDNDLLVPIELTPPFVPSRGTNVHLPGNMTRDNPDEWKFDKAHSNVLWSTNYRGAAGSLTGRFDAFGIHDVTEAKMGDSTTYPYTDVLNPSQPLKDSSWAFYENEPAKTYFNGYVQINTSNTGEPQRDGTFTYKGCNLDALGTTLKIPNYHNLMVTNLAKIKTTEVKFDPASNGYIVTLDLTWRNRLTKLPVTKTIVGTLKYIPRAHPTTGGVTYDVFGLQLKFQFNCRDFGVESASISDLIDIECNMNFNNR
ncbi:YceI family protein [Terrimonas alba]|uniref:YceI family protein n=1 Tax=Terrimonas alba TaxID=3349636 RepID=UPI0035F25FBB